MSTTCENGAESAIVCIFQIKWKKKAQITTDKFKKCVLHTTAVGLCSHDQTEFGQSVVEVHFPLNFLLTAELDGLSCPVISVRHWSKIYFKKTDLSTSTYYLLLGLCIGKDIMIRYASRYLGHDTIIS